MSVKILEDRDSKAKISRMAYQLYEWAFDFKELVLIGIDTRGGHIADMLKGHLETISSLKLELYNLPREGKLETTKPLKGKPVVLVDDVHYTGKTLLDAVHQIAEQEPSHLQVAVLIDRGHHLYPLKAQFTGVELATTLQEYIRVTIDDKSGNIEAFLD